MRRRVWLATFLAPICTVAACGDDGNTCAGINCDESAALDGDESQVARGCFPEAVSDLQPGTRYECQGTGNAWARLEYRNLVNKVTAERRCYKPPGFEGAQIPDDCLTIDLSALESTSAASPWACCSESAGAEVVALACDIDCGHAACRMAVEYLDEMAAKIDGKIEAKARFKQDLRDYADTLAQPDQQELCVGLVSAAALAGDYAKIDLNEAPGKDKPGHIENLTLYLRCDVSEIVQSKSAGANQCTEAANAQ